MSGLQQGAAENWKALINRVPGSLTTKFNQVWGIPELHASSMWFEKRGVAPHWRHWEWIKMLPFGNGHNVIFKQNIWTQRPRKIYIDDKYKMKDNLPTFVWQWFHLICLLSSYVVQDVKTFNVLSRTISGGGGIISKLDCVVRANMLKVIWIFFFFFFWGGGVLFCFYCLTPMSDLTNTCN